MPWPAEDAEWEEGPDALLARAQAEQEAAAERRGLARDAALLAEVASGVDPALERRRQVQRQWDAVQREMVRKR